MAKEAGRNQTCTYFDNEYYIDGVKMVRFCDLSFVNHTFQELLTTIDKINDVSPYNVHISSLLSMLKTLDSRESTIAQHSFMVNRIAMALGRVMKLPDQEMLQLNWGTLLHDIGKLGIADSILLKPAALNTEEYQIIKRHPLVGYELVKNNEYLTSAGAVILCHHERWDGHGYPNNMQGNQIPLLARICSVADTAAAMAEDRPYRKALPITQIADELLRNAGTQFDPQIVEAFVTMPEKEKVILRSST
ncbi:HD-GYP domain-containing protein [Sporomusa ovata]|nr:HD-GYP domain-containing protein [Sporomusa ovata]